MNTVNIKKDIIMCKLMFLAITTIIIFEANKGCSEALHIHKRCVFGCGDYDETTGKI